MAEHFAQSPYLLRTGHVDLGRGERLAYWELGHGDAPTTIIEHHGGPGAGVSDAYAASHLKVFQPVIEGGQSKVVFYDQRGAGESQPHFGTENEAGELVLPTTRQLVEDAESLRDHLVIGRFRAAGGSNGSLLTLAHSLYLAEQHPDIVDPELEKMMIWGVTLGDPIRYIEQHATGSNLESELPPEWQMFIGPVPSNLRSDGAAVIRFYHDALFPEIENEETMTRAKELAAAFGALRLIGATSGQQRESMRSLVAGKPLIEIYGLAQLMVYNPLAYARNSVHSMRNAVDHPKQVPDILGAIHKINNIPLDIIVSIDDALTPPLEAEVLASRYGSNCNVTKISGGHDRGGMNVMPALQRGAERLAN